MMSFFENDILCDIDKDNDLQYVSNVIHMCIWVSRGV